MCGKSDEKDECIPRGKDVLKQVIYRSPPSSRHMKAGMVHMFFMNLILSPICCMNMFFHRCLSVCLI